MISPTAYTQVTQIAGHVADRHGLRVHVRHHDNDGSLLSGTVVVTLWRSNASMPQHGFDYVFLDSMLEDAQWRDVIVQRRLETFARGLPDA